MNAMFEQIKNLERSLLTSEVRADPDKLDHLLADDFIEIGQSGRLYNKADILKELTGALQSTARFFDFDIRTLSDTLILVGYTSDNHDVIVHRHSLWEKNGEDWQILYHEAEAQNG